MSKEERIHGKCFACDRPFSNGVRTLVDTRDDQTVYVGRSCLQKIKAAGELGWQPPKGGPRLYLIAAETKLEPQTVAETIDWRQYAIGLDNAYTSWDLEARALAQQAQHEDAATNFMVEKISEWLKSFVQRIHSPAPDTKGPQPQ